MGDSTAIEAGKRPYLKRHPLVVSWKVTLGMVSKTVWLGYLPAILRR